MEKQTYTVNEAAEILGIHPNTVRRHIKAGTLSAFRVGKRVLIPCAGVEKLLAGKADPQPTPTDADLQRVQEMQAWAAKHVLAAPTRARRNTLHSIARTVGFWSEVCPKAEALEALTQIGVSAGIPEAEAREVVLDGYKQGKQTRLDLRQAARGVERGKNA